MILQLQGSLVDDEAPASSAAKDKDGVKPDESTSAQPKTRTPNQKAHLVATLLSIGALTEGRQILQMHPTLHIAHSNISEAMSRIIHVVIDPVYKALSPISKLMRNWTPPTTPNRNLTNTTNFKLCFSDSEKLLAKKQNGSGYRFFYSDWKTGITAYEDANTAMKVARALLAYVGPHLSKDIRLMNKLIRIGRNMLEQVSSIQFSPHELT